jgi:hypothetical protein
MKFYLAEGELLPVMFFVEPELLFRAVSIRRSVLYNFILVCNCLSRAETTNHVEERRNYNILVVCLFNRNFIWLTSLPHLKDVSFLEPIQSKDNCLITAFHFTEWILSHLVASNHRRDLRLFPFWSRELPNSLIKSRFSFLIS